MENLKITAEEAALNFVRGLIQRMNLQAEAELTSSKEAANIRVTGQDVGAFIGRRGETLDAIQYLATVVAGNVGKTSRRLVLDAEDYRERANDFIIRRVDRIVVRVIEHSRAERLEAMKSFERLLVHKHLSKHPDVNTRSEGREPARYIVIEPKNYTPPEERDPYAKTAFNRNGQGRKPRSFGAKKKFH